MQYNHQSVEAKVKKAWATDQIYKTQIDKDKPKYYVLDMFPYPSGAGLHVGHPLGYIASDIYSRYKRQNGFNVLHPMGYDAFGLPAEQYAIQTGVHPADSTATNIAKYKEQLNNIGFDYDWDRKVETTDPAYYKWTQWIFIQLFEHYYCTKAQKAMPITDLVKLFETEGSHNTTAFGAEDLIFDNDEWAVMTKIEQADILMNYRLAYRKESFVNWCEELGTVLANDEVKDGRSERGGYPVIKKPMLQWSLRVTAYAERLLDGLNNLEWSESLKTIQRNWIGKSSGAQVFFPIKDANGTIEVFTTRPDTIFGVTYMVLAPEHDLVNSITTPEQADIVKAYQDAAAAKSDIDRMSNEKEVSGAFTGGYATHPFTGNAIPIYISDYVLKDYGTGAIMAVPAEDPRDHRFAKKFDLPIIEVQDKSDFPDAEVGSKVGVMINSDFLNGMKVKDAIKAAISAIYDKGLGARKRNYKLRDANYSRQRYWGEPFPIIYDNDGIAKAVPLDQLPVELPPLDDFKPTAEGKSPLARVSDWVNTPEGKRETDTMPGFAGSSWYFLRYMDSQNPDNFVSEDAVNYWQDVDLYIGGTEHAVGHLMYSRFWHKFLYDLGHLPTDEPFKKLINQGMIQGVIESIYLQKVKEDGRNKFLCSQLAEANGIDQYTAIPIHIDFVTNYGSEDSYINMSGIKRFLDWRPKYKDAIFECGNGTYSEGKFISKNGSKDAQLLTHSEVGKMSKSKYNVINPDNIIEQYGADCFRMYEMFLGPIEQSKPWDMNGIEGVSKFIKKLWSLFYIEEKLVISDDDATKDQLAILHKTIKKVRKDIEGFSFNTCISAFMVAVNELKKAEANSKQVLIPLVQLLAPFAPFLTEHLWAETGHTGSIHHSDYPIFDASFLVSDSVVYPVCVNGKKRADLETTPSQTQDQLIALAEALPAMEKWLSGGNVVKTIVVPNRMINFVIKG